MSAASPELKPPFSPERAPSDRARVRLALLALLMLAAMAMACRSSENDENPRGLVVVNATATGTVRRVLVNEGATVAENAVILEIAEQTQSQTAPPSQTDDSQARAQADNATALREIQAAEAEVERAAVEVQRVQPLVASGAAAQAQLDAARAGYQQAQEKLQRAKEKAQSAQRNFVLQQGRAQSQATAKPAERIVAVRVPSSGVVRVISVRAGERVAAGQPIATVAADKR